MAAKKRKMHKGPIACDFPTMQDEPTAALSATRLYEFSSDYSWSGVQPQQYKLSSDDWADVVRHVIVGNRGEETKFHVRYFEIAPGGYTSLEKHQHAHVVIGVRGKAKMIAGIECYELNFLDTIYIAPNTPHQLVNDADEPFGFFCLVDAERDRPQPLDQEELERIKASPRAGRIVRF
jgi:quercetin dioxygenase-like cupin family protein